MSPTDVDILPFNSVSVVLIKLSIITTSSTVTITATLTFGAMLGVTAVVKNSLCPTAFLKCCPRNHS